MTDAGKHAPWFILALVGVAALFRLPGLEYMPPPLNQDEASRGYDAWCLLETGADRHGARWPFFLESFGPGDYTAALTTYLTIPFVAWLGPTATAMRLPDALLGVATVLLLYLWLRRQVNETVALLAAGVLAVDPWHIALCRTAHESGFTPFFLVLALLALHRAGLLPAEERLPPSEAAARQGRHCSWWGFAAGFALAMHTWAYPATRLFTPLFCLAILVIQARDYLARWKVRETRTPILATGLGLVIGAVPLWWTALTHPEYLAARAHATLLIYRSSSLFAAAGQFLANYAAQFHPFTSFGQADEMSGASIPWVGRHLPILAPLWLIGLVRMFGGLGRSIRCRLLVAWMVLYPVPAAICGDWNPHPLRSVAGIAVFPIVAALGGHWLIDRLTGRSHVVRRVTAVLVCLAVMVNLVQMSNAYFRQFPASPSARAAYQTGLYDAMAFAARYEPAADVVLVTNQANQAYIYALLLEPIWPQALAASPPVVSPGPGGFHQVLRAGRYLFVPQDPLHFPEAGELFQQALEGFLPDARGLVIDVDRGDRPATHDGAVLFRSDPGAAQNGAEPVYVVCRWSPRGRGRT